MQRIIEFQDITYATDGTLSCTIRPPEPADLHIKLPFHAHLDHQTIALALATLCGTNYDEIKIDLPLGPQTKNTIQTHTKASLTCHEGADTVVRPGSNTALNFSGGFDSLAALALLDNPELVSLDFGGRFERERKFFSRFNSHIIETNLVDLGLNRNSWQFMGIGTILLRNELHIRHYSFGSIMAGSLGRLISGPQDQYHTGLWTNRALATRRLNPVAGISEIGSLRIVVQTYPQLLVDALRSVANPKEDKYTRKTQMLRAVCKDVGIPIELPRQEQPTRKLKWGQSLATDLSSIYVMTKLGVSEVAETYENGVPDAIADSISNLNLDFYTRINPHAYAGIPENVKSRLFEKLISRGFEPFHRHDWDDARRVLDLITNSPRTETQP